MSVAPDDVRISWMVGLALYIIMYTTLSIGRYLILAPTAENREVFASNYTGASLVATF